MELRLPPHIEKSGNVYVSKITGRFIPEKNIKPICDLYWENNPPTVGDYIEEVSELSQEQFEYLSHSKRPINNKIENLTWVNKPKCPVCGGSGEIELIMFDAIKCRCKK